MIKIGRNGEKRDKIRESRDKGSDREIEIGRREVGMGGTELRGENRR